MISSRLAADIPTGIILIPICANLKMNMGTWWVTRVAHRADHIALVDYLSGEFVLRDHEEIRWVSREELALFDFADADLPIVEKLEQHIL